MAVETSKINDISTATIAGNVTVVQPTGSNLHTVIDSGTLTGVTNPVTVSQATAASLNATVVGTVTATQATGTNLHVVVDTAPTTTVTGTVTANQGGSWTVTTTPPANASTNLAQIGGNTISTAATGSQKVGISGAAGATLDAVTTAATAPANALATLAVNQTTPPSLTTGQSVALQCDYEGSLFIKPLRRAQVVSQAATVATTAATTVLAAQAAGIFSDIAHFSLSATPIATSVATLATLSDGTKSYLFDFIPGTATAAGTGLVIEHFNPPIPATSAATAWTLTMSTTNTVHTKIVAILQKAS